MKHLLFWTCLAFPLIVGNVAADTKVTITIAAGKHNYKNTPMVIPLSLPADVGIKRDLDHTKPQRTAPDLKMQLTAPDLLTETIQASAASLRRRDLHLVVPILSAGERMTLRVDFGKGIEPPDGYVGPIAFKWVNRPHKYAELLFNSRPVLRYMDMPYDSNPKKRVFNYKVFHHVYDPEGKFFVTNGGETDYPNEPKRKLLFPHHRGLMYAFNKITYNGKTVDTWHAKPGDTHQEHVKILNEEAGPVLGRHRVLVDWHGADNQVFAKEEREVTAYNLPGGTLIEFASRLKTVDGPIKLAGDPQHAGFQFRARQDVADKTAKQTYYLRPDGKGELDETRNWDPKKKGPVNLPWNAMSFVLDGKRYTVAYLDKPTNPRESRWSERDYGRFGNYFEFEVTKDHPLLVNYRIWLQEGEMMGQQVQALSTEFVTPPEVSVK